MTQFKTLLISLLLVLQVLGAGSYFKGPGLIEGFTTVTSAAGTTTLTKDSETKQILTGATTQTFVLPDATTLPLGRYFNMINKSSGIMTVQTSGGGALTTVDPGVQKEVHLRAAGSAAGTWDVLAGGGGGVWGSITGTLSAQTDLNTALGLKAPSASPTFTGTIGTPLTASKLLATDASGNLTATAANSSQATYLDLTSSAQTQLNAKLSTSNYSAKGDIVAGVSSGVVAGVTVGSNGKVLTADSNATAGVRWDDPKINKNYVTVNNGEGGVTTGWSTYADAAGTKPVDCTGGSPNSTWTASASSTIHGSNNFLATLNTGATRQGEGVSYAFTVDSGDSPAMMSIRFYYKVAGGTFAAGNDADRTSTGDSDFTVWIYDVTNGTLIQPYTYRLYSNSTGVAEPFVSNFQTNSNSTSYRLCIHKGTPTSVSGTAITVRFDDFEVSRSNIATNTPISDWQSYTPTGSWTTNTTYTGRWRRVGDTLESQINLVLAGAPTAADLTVNFLPSGLTVDSAKMAAFSFGSIGDANIIDSGSRVYIANPAYNGGSSVYIAHTESGNTGIVNATNPITFASADNVRMNIRVPITGWSSSTQVSDGYDARPIVLSRFNQTTQSINNAVTSIIDFPVASIDTTNSWRASSGAFNSAAGTFATTNPGFVVPSSGEYRISAGVRFQGSVSPAANSNLLVSVYLDGTLAVDALGSWQNGGSAGTNIGPGASGSATIRARAGQVIDIRVTHSFGAAAVLDNNSRTYLSIEKLQAPTTMSATEVVAARYTTAAAQSIPNTTTNTIIDFGTKVYDTHNAVTTGASWKFTAPIAGLYKTCAFIHYSSANAWTAGNAVYATIFKSTVAWATIDDFPVMASVTDAIPIKGCTTVQMNAGDYIDLETAHNRTGGSAALTNSGILNYIEIERIK